MQVVSGPDYRRVVHFEAPPSARMAAEMERFVAWFNDAAPSGGTPMPALTRAGIAHLYFVCIHPFEDGNGRIGRALAEKSLAQSLGHPSLIALAYTIERKRRDYYMALERSNKDNEITGWLTYFAETVLEAQRNTLARVEFLVAKARFYERLRGRLNERQERVIASHVPRGDRRLPRRLERGELRYHQQSVARDGDARSARPCRERRAHPKWGAPLHAISSQPRAAEMSGGRAQFEGCAHLLYVFSRYPVRNIHHTVVRHTTRNTAVMARLMPTWTSAKPTKAQRKPLMR